jgi:hypothetical protein
MALTPTRDRALDERTRGAWATYALSLEGLEGREYEEAEAQAWEALQRELQVLQAQPPYGSRPDRRSRV